MRWCSCRATPACDLASPASSQGCPHSWGTHVPAAGSLPAYPSGACRCPELALTPWQTSAPVPLPAFPSLEAPAAGWLDEPCPGHATCGLRNSCFVFVRFPLALSEDSVCGLIGAGTASSCLRSTVPSEGTSAFSCPGGAFFHWEKPFTGPCSSPLLPLAVVAPWACEMPPRSALQKQAGIHGKPLPGAPGLLPASAHQERHLEKPCSPPNQSQQFSCSPLPLSACSGLAPRLHPHLRAPPPSPLGVFLPLFPLCPSLRNCAMEHIVSAEPGPLALALGLSFVSAFKERNHCCAEPASQPRLLRDRAAGVGKKGTFGASCMEGKG